MWANLIIKVWNPSLHLRWSELSLKARQELHTSKQIAAGLVPLDLTPPDTWPLTFERKGSHGASFMATYSSTKEECFWSVWLFPVTPSIPLSALISCVVSLFFTFSWKSSDSRLLFQAVCPDFYSSSCRSSRVSVIPSPPQLHVFSLFRKRLPPLWALPLQSSNWYQLSYWGAPLTKGPV